MKRFLCQTGLCVVLILSLGGCGTTLFASGQAQSDNQAPTTLTHGNPNTPFINKLNDELVTPINAFNAISVNKLEYKNIPVYLSNGQQVNLDVNNVPIFFEAYWCPHCQRTLVLWDKFQNRLERTPVIVSGGYQPGTTLEQAVAISQEEFKSLGLKGFKIYYLLDSAKKYVPNGIPALVFKNNNVIDMLVGEHSLAVWERALKYKSV